MRSGRIDGAAHGEQRYSRTYPWPVAHTTDDARGTRSTSKEAIGFVVVGVLNLGVEIALFNLLSAPIGPVGAKALATIVASVSAFLMNKYWTFSHRTGAGIGREFGIFAVAALIATAINAGVVAIAHYGMHVTDTVGLNIANLIGIALATIFRFIAYKHWVFSRVVEPASAARD